MIKEFFKPSVSTVVALNALALVALAGCASAPGTPPATAAAAPVAPGELKPLVVYGNEGNQAPNIAYLGTPANWAFVIPKNGLGAMDAGSVKAEPTKVGDNNGIKVTWTGGIGQVYSQSKISNDQIDYVEANAALVFDTILHKAPEDQVTMRVDCRYPCMGVVDVTEYLKKQQLEKLTTVKIPLACFEKGGTKFAVVNTPWLIFTTKALSMSIANVRYVPGAAKDADVAMKCGA
ncbi:putative glycoside hydrolase [Niveibacterium sp. SC-1]|uniref:putative glycoside hydrolase n=1 Tax=Niveibacterium sp. SC-1 TaxID=3135646 RepID=UPI00311DC4F0